MSLPQQFAQAAKALVPGSLKHRWREFRWDPTRLMDVPGSSRWFGPARHWVRAEHYCRWNGGTLREVLPAQVMPSPVFRQLNPIPARFLTRFVPDVPAASIIELEHVRLAGPNGWIIGARDSYLLDTSFWAYPNEQMDWRDHYMLQRRPHVERRKLPGRTLSLASDFAIGGFGHFLHDSATRLLLVERARLDPRDFDWIYWPHPESPAAGALLAASGLPREKILSWPGHHDLECESLTATTFPGRPGHIAPVYADFLRRRFGRSRGGPPTRKIYLTREGFRRNFRNAVEIDAVFQRFGYEICRAHDDPAVFSRCAEATHVAAIEGANFFNAFACPAGTRALLILPDCGPTTPYTLTLGLSAGLEMNLLAARSLDQPQVDAGIADIYLDPAELADALARLEAA